MPAGQGKDAERFAASVELGRPLDPTDDELRQDLEIVAMLRARGGAYSPHPEAKARAKQRLMAALAAEQGHVTQVGAPAAAELTAPLARILTPPFPAVPDVDAAAVTTQMAVVVDDSATIVVETTAGDPTAGDPTVGQDVVAADASAPVPASARPGRHAGRHTMPSRPAAGPRRSRSASHGLRRRAVLVGSAALVAMIALTGGGVFASRTALPGDTLYGLKRASESAGLALTFDDEAKARRHLDLASTRLDEVEAMVARRPQTPADAAVLQSTIREFDSATGEGSRMLLAADDAGGAAALGDLRAWATEQVGRLSVLRAALPVPAMSGADNSIELLDRLLGRAGALEDRSSCTRVTSGASDDLGSLPAEGACTPRPVVPADEAAGAGTSRSTGTPGSSGAATTVPGSTDPTVPGTPGSGTGPDTGAGVPTQDGQTPGLLPGVDVPELPGSTRLDTGTGTSRNTTTPPSGGGGNLSAPLPLLPPITLPPLLPGLPGITIG